MPKVELVYERSCPNIAGARAQILRAFSETQLTPIWQEWEVNEPDTPTHVHGYGSPTILVNGVDVAGETPHDTGACCRIYAASDSGNRGVPAVELIVKALEQASAQDAPAKGSNRWKSTLAVVPPFATALLPKLTCPACWPAYAGLLSSLGVGFFDYTPYLLALTLGFIVICLITLGYRASARRGYSPLALGIVASLLLTTGKFEYNSDAAMYAGLMLLVGASL